MAAISADADQNTGREAGPDQHAAGRLARLGAACARRPLVVLLVWLLALAGVLVARHAVDASYSNDVSLPGTQSDTGMQLLKRSAPGAGGNTGRVVFHVEGGRVADRQDAVAASLTGLRGLPHVTDVTALATSEDGGVAYASVILDVRPKTLGPDYVHGLDAATGPARAAGLKVAYGGDFDQITRAAAKDGRSELIGLAAALIVLLLAFGSVLAAVLPLLTAAVAVGVGMSVVGIVAGVVTFGTSAPTLAIMIGLGVGVDYALFLATRFRQDIADGYDPVDAAGRTASSSGRAVLVAAVTVALALLSLYACGVSFIGKLGLAATFTVAVAAAAALTLVPAALGLCGRRIDKFAVRKPVAETTGDRDRWIRYAGVVARHPWRFLVAGLAVLVLLSAPLLDMRLGHVDGGSDPVGSHSRTAYDLVADGRGPGFGPGANVPLTVVVDLQGARVPAERIGAAVDEALRATPGVVPRKAVHPSPDGRLLVATVTPSTRPADAATGTLVHTLTRDTLPHALAGTGAHGYVAGSTAGQLDFRDIITQRLPIIIGVVLVAAFVLLMLVFRSLLIPVKAVLLNLFATGAAYGVVVAVFQWGWGRSLLGIDQAVPVESYVPMMMFAIVFGLSMDYEVFLLSRIAEAWHETGDNTRAVGVGLARTGRVIGSAALIMTAVFLAFAASPTVVVKMLAIGLAASVVIDATLVRLVLVPASMVLMGRWNWWLPKRLDKVLPRVSV
ncbi:MMPL family transporter [Yinghuangia seranimata]|uniref:MMPL family transporter n=1 Tax=Yinghuangia seranimata TaxID=408067 RepID=UPI00248C217F|nr:MMPL family transporter [Yinghuangia seranimata]MDI2129610.1 MMPL family transporter [Yinghuangia seranimata]